MLRIVFVVGFASLVGACASTDTSMHQSSIPGGPTVITGSGTVAVAVAGPAGCAGPITEYQQIIDRDVESGHLNPGVYNRLATDLEPVKRACAEGREAEARNQLAGVKARYGYR